MIPVITVDGPSGSGKGTLAALLAKRLGWHLLDSGALYRILGALALARGIDCTDSDALVAIARALDVRFEAGEVRVHGEVLTERIRHEEVGEAASTLAALPAVRAAILDLQRSFRCPPGLVADGRDMGTVVFPDAPLKLFLDASAEERAWRRYNQLKNKGLSVSFRALLAAIEERDARDRGRAVSPLKPAADAILIDSTRLSIDEVLEVAMAEVVALGLVSST